MTAPLLYSVPLDAPAPTRAEPEQLVLSPVALILPFVVPEPWAVRCARRRTPKPRCAAKAPEPDRYGGGDLWRPALPETDINLVRSRRRKYPVPRMMLAGDSHETLGNRPLTRAERADMEMDLLHLVGVRFGPPKDDRDCPTGPCAHVSCRHHLYLEINRDRTTLNWPGRHVDELPETCSIRAARAAAVRRQESGRPEDPAMSCSEVGRHLNLTAETVRKDLKRALIKLRAGGVNLGD